MPYPRLTIERDGQKLLVKLSAARVNYHLHFSHNAHSEGDAEAWRVLLQERQDAIADSDTKQEAYLRQRVDTLERRVAGLRGVITQLRRKLYGTPAPRPRS